MAQRKLWFDEGLGQGGDDDDDTEDDGWMEDANEVGVQARAAAGRPLSRPVSPRRASPAGSGPAHVTSARPPLPVRHFNCMVGIVCVQRLCMACSEQGAIN